MLLRPFLILALGMGSTLAAIEIPSMEDLCKLSATGFLGVAVLWMLAKVIPNLVHVFTESIKDITAQHAAAIKDIRAAQEENRKAIGDGFDKVAQAVEEQGTRQIDLLTKIALQTK